MADPVNPHRRGSDAWIKWNKRQERVKARAERAKERAQRAEARQRRLDEAAKKVAEGVSAVALCKEAVLRVPPEYQGWGAKRTHSYLEAMRAVASIARAEKPSRGRAIKAANALTRAMSDPIETL